MKIETILWYIESYFDLKKVSPSLIKWVLLKYEPVNELEYE